MKGKEEVIAAGGTEGKWSVSVEEMGCETLAEKLGLSRKKIKHSGKNQINGKPENNQK